MVKILFWKQGSIEYKVKKGFVSDQEISEVKIRCLLASFPGLTQLQFLITCSI